jgi:hypothetical protein
MKIYFVPAYVMMVSAVAAPLATWIPPRADAASSDLAQAGGRACTAQPPMTNSSDPVVENFGARVAPYSGFLVLAPAAFPAGYAEKSHHYTKCEYTLTLAKTIDGQNFTIEIIESDLTRFFVPHYPVVKEFD